VSQLRTILAVVLPFRMYTIEDVLALGMGKTTAKIVRSWDTVNAGAFFPKRSFQVPQKKMGQHRRPACDGANLHIFAHFIRGPSPLGFAFFKTLFNSPTADYFR